MATEQSEITKKKNYNKIAKFRNWKTKIKVSPLKLNKKIKIPRFPTEGWTLGPFQT